MNRRIDIHTILHVEPALQVESRCNLCVDQIVEQAVPAWPCIWPLTIYGRKRDNQHDGRGDETGNNDCGPGPPTTSHVSVPLLPMGEYAGGRLFPAFEHLARIYSK